MTDPADLPTAKPRGSIPADFKGRDSALLIGGYTADDLIAHAGDTPLFVYDLAIVRARVDRLRAAMPHEIAIHFAIKANPLPAFVAAGAELFDGLDVASAGELARALEAGASPDRISFAGPGKRDRELAAAIAAGVTINLESEGEADRALTIAARNGVRPRLALRVNPDFELKRAGLRMGGGAQPFGIDAARAAALVLRILAAGAEWRGLHIFAGSQVLDPEAIIEAQAATIALAARLSDDIGVVPPLVNLGGGFGIPYFAGDRPLDVERIGVALGDALSQRPSSLADSRFAIELGRWLVGEAGVYLTRIVDRKVSHGEVFLVTDGGLHHQLAATGNLGMVVRRSYPLCVANRFGAAPEEVASVVGCLCTPLDRLGDRVALPRARVGDVIAVFMAGAYGRSASPEAFLGHPPARELLIDLAGGLSG